MELGSVHDGITEVAKQGVLLALQHNMLPKPILQEALRCVRLRVAASHPSVLLRMRNTGLASALTCHPDSRFHRPILTDLAFYNRINLRLLRHLHRLLVGFQQMKCLPTYLEWGLALKGLELSPFRAGSAVKSVQCDVGGQTVRAPEEVD